MIFIFLKIIQIHKIVLLLHLPILFKISLFILILHILIDYLQSEIVYKLYGLFKSEISKIEKFYE